MNSDRNDKAVQMYLKGQFKEMRDRLNDSCRVQKIEIACTPMSDSITSSYNNRPMQIMNKMSKCNVRKLSQIKDQE